ncbi:MAG: helix-turn-helix transcriptional regulator [Alphaproteobacteria bacterium]|nr:helix-turn-helix transcriptional regulator [Alphaproteobacteria bacterium]
MEGKTLKELKKDWLKDPEIRAIYDSMAFEFYIASVLIRTRLKAKLTQTELAERMHSTQAHVARLESGKFLPSLTSLVKYCEAVGQKIVIELTPRK